MNLIQQLQQTPKWKEFEEWYFKRYMEGKGSELINGLVFTFKTKYNHFDEWKGVFEKFIESQEGVFEQEHTGSGYRYSIWDVEEGYDEFNSFEELLIWYFNN